MGRNWRRQQPEGLTVDEVARKLGISRQRVYQLEASGLRKLRKGLLDRGYGEEMLDFPTWLICYFLETALSDSET